VVVTLFNSQRDFPVARPFFKKVVKSILVLEGVSCDEVSIHFVKETEIQALHARYFGDPTSTDCISFPFADSVPSYCFLGEVFICPLVALRYAASKKLDPLHEVTLYLVHGLLHLLGFDDISPKERRRMRRAEKRIMNHLKQQNLLS